MVFVVVFVVVAAAVVCNFCRTQIAVGHRIQGGSPAPLLFPYAVGYSSFLFSNHFTLKGGCRLAISYRVYYDIYAGFVEEKEQRRAHSKQD